MDKREPTEEDKKRIIAKRDEYGRRMQWSQDEWDSSNRELSQVQGHKWFDLESTIEDKMKEADGYEANTLPKSLHPYVYPNLENVECVASPICEGSMSTHDNRSIYLILEWLLVQRGAQDRFNIGIPFDYEAMDFKNDLEGLKKKFKAHLDTVTVPGKKVILVMECGSCGNTRNLYSAYSNWGHRTLLIAKYQGYLSEVEYYDCLGDQTMTNDQEQLQEGIAISKPILEHLIEPLSRGPVLKIPESSVYMMMPGAQMTEKQRKKKMFVQHGDEFMCQNWVVCFADARMWSSRATQSKRKTFEATDWIRFIADPRFTPYLGEEGQRESLQSDFTLLVWFHLFHLRRWLWFSSLRNANQVVLDQHQVSVARTLNKQSWAPQPGSYTIESFSVKFGALKRSLIPTLFHILPEKLQAFATRTQLWQPIFRQVGRDFLVFPADNDSVEYALDPLFVMQAWFVE